MNVSPVNKLLKEYFGNTSINEFMMKFDPESKLGFSFFPPLLNSTDHLTQQVSFFR